MPRLVTVPLPAWVLVWSAVAAFLGWVCVRAGRNRIGIVAACAGILFAIVLMLRPQLTAQALAAMQPGVAAFGMVLAVVILRRMWLSRTGRRLPAFGPINAPSASSSSRPFDLKAESQSRATPIPLAPQSGATT